MEKTLHNINIERAILSSIIFEPSIFDEVNSTVKFDVFYMPAHQNIYSAMLSLWNDQQPIDEEFLKNRLTKDSKYDEIALVDILTTTPINNKKAYVEELIELYRKRELLALTTVIKKVTIEDDSKSEVAIDFVQQKLYQISADVKDKDFRDGLDITKATLTQIQKNKERGNSLVIGLDTGFFGLNEKTAGFGKGDLVIIAARPAMGKTAFALNLASNVLNQNLGVAIFSLEMPAEQLMLRMLSAKTSINLQDLKTGNLDDEKYRNLSQACDFYAKSKIFVDDDSVLTIGKLRSKLRELKSRESSVSLCIVDYLQLMSGNSSKDRHIEVSEISRGLKMLARELEIPIIALSQLNRSVESRSDKRPMLSDIRESGSIEQDADIIMFVYRDDVYKAYEEKQKEKKAQEEGKPYVSNFKSKLEEEAEIIIGKHRNGPIGTVDMVFQKQCTRFVDATKGKVVKETVFKDTKIPVTFEETNTNISNIDMPII